MGNGPIQPRRRSVTWDRLLSETLNIYRAAFRPLVLTALVGVLPTSVLIAVWSPEAVIADALWRVVAFAPTYVAQAALTTMAFGVRRARPPDMGVAYATALSVAPRYVTGSIFIQIMLLVSGLFILTIPIGLYLVTRLALFGPAVVIEMHDVRGAFRRSWQLTDKRVLRTLIMVLAFIVLLFLVAFVAAAIGGGNAGAQIVFITIVQTLVVPLQTVFFLLLFEDYRGLSEEGGPEQFPT